MTTKRRKERLALILIAAASIGTSSAVLSGTLAMFGAQHPDARLPAMLA